MSLKVELLENSFEAVKPQADEFVNSFYNNLFTMYPEAKPLFAHSNMADQKKKLLASLVLVVENLKEPDVLSDTLKGLGARHVKYGALPEHYPLVGSSLLTTFEQYLRSDWTSEVREAWVEAYAAITELMLDGADYSQEEVALKTIEGGHLQAPPQKKERVSADTETDLKAVDRKTEFSELETTNLNKFSHAGSDGTAAIDTNNSKAGIYAFAGGGIMGIIALLLILI